MIARFIRRMIARYALARIVRATRDSYETRRWIERRAAALKSPHIAEARRRGQEAIAARRARMGSA